MSSYSYVMANISNYPEKYNIVDKNYKVITLRSNDVIDEILSDSIKKYFIDHEFKSNEKNVPVKLGDEIKNIDVNVRYYFDDFVSFKSVAIVESVCDGTELDLHDLLNDVFEKIAKCEIINEKDKSNQYKIDYNETADKHTAKCKIAFGNPIIIDQYGIFADEFGKERHFKLTCALPYVLNPRRSFWEIFSDTENIHDVERTAPDEPITFTNSTPLTGTISGTLTNTTAATVSHTHTNVDADTDVSVHSNTSRHYNLDLPHLYGNNDDTQDAPRFSAGIGYDLDSSAAANNCGTSTNADIASANSVRDIAVGRIAYAANLNNRRTGYLTGDSFSMITNTADTITDPHQIWQEDYERAYNEVERAYSRVLQRQRPRVECMNRLVDINV